MEQFIVSARKYRPASFEPLVGQDGIARTLKNSILSGQLAHAYLFCGPRGVGKTTSARIFAKSINCLNPGPDMEPCGECESCRSFAEGRSYCIHELDAASNNSVDDIRTLTEQVRIPPQVGRYSVYIIDEVHMLSQQAFNAFLKTLEEPPAHAIFILATTEKHKILPTILSRCQTYDFNRIGIADMVSNLKMIASKENVEIDDDALHIIAMKADGAMRDALTLFDQSVAFCGRKICYEDVVRNLNVLDYEYYFKTLDAALAGDYTSAIVLFDRILSKGFNALHFVGGLSGHLRDLVVCKNQASQYLLNLPPTLIKRYNEQAARCSVEFLYKALGVTTNCEAQYRGSGNQRLLVEFALMKLAMINAAPVQAAVQSPAPAVQTPAPVAANPAPFAPSAPAAPAAPAVPEAPAAPTAQTAPAAKLPGMSSIKAAMAKVQGTDKPAVEVIAGTFSRDTFTKAWNEFAESTRPLRAALCDYILNNIPEWPEQGHEFVFELLNAAQQKWVAGNLLDKMVTYLRSRTGCNDLNVQLRIKESAPEEHKPYMPLERAQAILSDNEQVRELKREFDLDIL